MRDEELASGVNLNSKTSIDDVADNYSKGAKPIHEEIRRIGRENLLILI